MKTLFKFIKFCIKTLWYGIIIIIAYSFISDFFKKEKEDETWRPRQ